MARGAAWPLVGRDDEAAHRLWDQSRGNALFLRELVTSGLEDHTLVERGGVWAGSGAGAPGPRLIELIDARIGTVTAEEQALLEILAVGEPLGAGLVADMTSRAVMGELERRGLVVVETAERRRNLRLTHPLYSERLQNGLGVLRKEEISRQLADTLEATGTRRRDDAFRMAAWRLDGGGPIEPELVLSAARRALALHDKQLGERLARAAAEAGGGHAAIVELGNALYWQGRHQDILVELLATVDSAAMSAQDRSPGRTDQHAAQQGNGEHGEQLGAHGARDGEDGHCPTHGIVSLEIWWEDCPLPERGWHE